MMENIMGISETLREMKPIPYTDAAYLREKMVEHLTGLETFRNYDPKSIIEIAETYVRYIIEGKTDERK
jgi:hypothetical protein